MFGMKALLARLERIEGSLLWIARELGGDQGLAALSRALAGQQARAAELGEAVVAQRRELEAQRQLLAQVAEAVAAQSCERAQIPVVEGLGKANETLDRIAEAVRSQGRELAEGPLAQGLGTVNEALDRIAEAQGPVAQGIGKVNEALHRLRETVSHLEGAPALREKLERMRLEMEALGEQGLRMVDLLTKAQDELEAVKAKPRTRKKKS